jgi:GntR family transcriptional regulator of vanillate catabolism
LVDSHNQRLESQTLRALLEMRELLLRGEFLPGERLREIPLSERLQVSRTPLRLVLDRLEQEGLLTARPTGGFVAAEFSVQDIHDGIEIRGMLEGAAARLAAERLERATDLDEVNDCLAQIDRLLERWASGTDSLLKYIPLNDQFHSLLIALAKSPMLRRAVERAVTLPFASPNAFILAHTQKKEGEEVIRISQMHHRAIVDAIANRETTRAEALAREHSRLARTSLEMVLRDKRLLTQLPGASLIRFPEVALAPGGRMDAAVLASAETPVDGGRKAAALNAGTRSVRAGYGKRAAAPSAGSGKNAALTAKRKPSAVRAGSRKDSVVAAGHKEAAATAVSRKEAV